MISQNLQTIIDDFDVLENWEDRYSYLIDRARKMPVLPPELKTPARLVAGCMSSVWLDTEISDGHFTMRADSDAILVRGLIAILHAAYDAQPISIVRDLDIAHVFAGLGLDNNLSPNRRNGFFAMVARIRALAVDLS